MAVSAVLALTGCGGGDHPAAGPPTPAHPSASAMDPVTPPSSLAGAASSTPAVSVSTPPAVATVRPAASLPTPGNPAGHVPVPAGARAADTSHPTRVIGQGTPAGCTPAAVVAAVAKGGRITFSCGPAPITITLTRTAKVRNTSAVVVLDGGGLVTLSGGGKRRILYQDTCDPAQGFTTSHCQDQDSPRLTVQNLTFADGNSTGQTAEGGGGGAIFVRGGRFKVVGSFFVRNRCDPTGPDLGGAAIRVLSQYHGQPVYVVGSTFGGAPGRGGRCSNGGALSSIGVSWTVINSLFSDNSAIGSGANPARSGSPGGGSGGAIYADGNTYTVRLQGTRIERNHAKEGGGAVFFVSNDRTGALAIDRSVLHSNPSAGFQTAGYPGIFFLGAGHPVLTGSKLG